MNTKHIIIIGVLLVGAFLLGSQNKSIVNLGGDPYTNTFNTGITSATTTINTTSTQVFSSISNGGFVTLVNSSTASITCSMDDQGTTAVSSSVAASKGVIIGAGTQPASTTAIKAQATFGYCWSGAENCFPFTGTLNCLATAIVTIPKVSK